MSGIPSGGRACAAPNPCPEGSWAARAEVDSASGMNAVPHEHGLALLAAHCASFDPDTLTAREQLDVALGPELAHKLVFALSSGGSRVERGRRRLRAFAA